jgi:hypothetical protein
LVIALVALGMASSAPRTQAVRQPMDGAPRQAVSPDRLLQFTSSGHVLGFAADAVYVASGSHAYRVEFVGAASTAPVADSAPSDSSRAAPMSRVTYPNLWRGIALTYDAPDGAILRGTYRLEPFANPADIRLRYNAAAKVESDGTLALAYATGVMRESAPIAWQERNGARVPIAIAFQVFSERQVGFALGAYDPASPLLIDPTLTWNTFLGGGIGDDWGYAIAVDGSGNVYVAGESNATWGSPVRAHTPGSDAFAARLDSSGGLTWNTFLGGSGSEGGLAIAVDGNGNVYVAGVSNATWGSPVRAYTAGADAFAARLDSSGGLTWNTFLGGSGLDIGRAIAVDGSGNVYVAGESDAAWGSPVRAYTAGADAFAARLSSSGGLTWNTFLGESEYDRGYAIAVDRNGNVYVAGDSESTWGSPVRAYTSGGDAFAARLDSSGGLTWNTFLGESGYDYGYAIAVDGSGNVYVAGRSGATWGSPVRAYTSGGDAFAARLDSSGGLTWNTFLGGSGFDYGYAIAVDGSGNVYVAGVSKAAWGSPVRAYTAGYDAFAARLDSSGGLAWNTFLGGNGWDEGTAIAVDGSGNVYVAGYSDAAWGSPVRAYTAGRDAFAVKLLPDLKIYLPLVVKGH